jgi:quercetin dioxygenase-like cupin family protein
MRVVGLRLEPGQNVPEHRNAIPVALIVTVGHLHFDDGRSEEASCRERV